MSQSSAPPPSVPYGPAADAPVPASSGAPSARGIGGTAAKWGLRLLLPLLLRLLFRALTRR